MLVHMDVLRVFPLVPWKVCKFCRNVTFRCKNALPTPPRLPISTTTKTGIFILRLISVLDKSCISERNPIDGWSPGGIAAAAP